MPKRMYLFSAFLIPIVVAIPVSPYPVGYYAANDLFGINLGET
jgi:hypothetical protein